MQLQHEQPTRADRNQIYHIQCWLVLIITLSQMIQSVTQVLLYTAVSENMTEVDTLISHNGIGTVFCNLYCPWVEPFKS